MRPRGRPRAERASRSAVPPRRPPGRAPACRAGASATRGSPPFSRTASSSAWRSTAAIAALRTSSRSNGGIVGFSPTYSVAGITTRVSCLRCVAAVATDAGTVVEPSTRRSPFRTRDAAPGESSTSRRIRSAYARRQSSGNGRKAGLRTRTTCPSGPSWVGTYGPVHGEMFSRSAGTGVDSGVERAATTSRASGRRSRKTRVRASVASMPEIELFAGSPGAGTPATAASSRRAPGPATGSASASSIPLATSRALTVRPSSPPKRTPSRRRTVTTLPSSLTVGGPSARSGAGPSWEGSSGVSGSSSFVGGTT